MVRALLVIGSLAILMLCAGSGLAAEELPSGSQPAAAAPAPAGTAGAEAAAYTPERVMSEFGKTVVVILAEKEGGAAALGTGFLVTDDGRIVTNYHVVQGAYPAQVKLRSGDIYDDISVINYDPRRDLAVIKIRGFSLPAVRLGNSDEAKAGEKVVVIGNPRGLENTISDGLLSAIRPNEAGFTEFQLSAPVSPGSSGGPVFNGRGEVIAVIHSQLVEGQNLNFGIPINYARAMISGPVKCTLRQLPKEGVPAVGLGQGPRTPAEELKLLIEAAALGFQAFDASEPGVPKCRWARRAESRYDVDRTAWVDPGMYEALEYLERAEQKVPQAETATGLVGELEVACRDAIGRMAEAQQDRVELLLRPWQLNSRAIFVAYSTTYSTAWGDLCDTKEKFNQACRELAPELLPLLPPALTLRTPIAAGQGFVGAGFPMGEDCLRLVEIERGEAADKAGLRVGDVVLGVADGPGLSKQMEFLTYIREHAGQKVKLRYRREGKERVATVVPKAYQP